MSPAVGSCCIVLHTHLPWLAGHGSWPVGEEWLYQAWAQSYLPLVELLERLGGEGRRDLLTLGITPVLATQLDDPYVLRQMHTWLGFWQARAVELATRPDRQLRELAGYEYHRSGRALETFESRWARGASPLLRRLADAEVIELLAGPATHPFQPLLDPRVAPFALRTGLDDHALRFGHRPKGIWAPECGYRPGLETLYAEQGVRRFLVDGPTLLHVGRGTDAGWTVGDTDVVAFGRDVDLSNRVWSPGHGYPSGPDYRDFHTYDHRSGFKPARVTSPTTPPETKAPYDPARGNAAVRADVIDFVSAVRSRLADIAADRGRPGVVVVAYDTELFGHWWHEGPEFLRQLLDALPAAEIELTTLRGATEAGHIGGRVDPEAGSWGAGQDFRVWDGEQVSDLVDLGQRVQRDLLGIVDATTDPARRPDLDAAARSALLTLSSDWAFMVSHDSAAEYARARAFGHAAEFDRAVAAAGSGPPVTVGHQPQHQPQLPFPHLDARLLRSGLVPSGQGS